MATRKVRDQASKRRSVKMRDQHGRTWAFTIDVDTMSPVGVGAWVGWKPPQLPGGRMLIPAHKYLVFDPEDLGKVEIDYQAWKQDLERANETWEQVLQSHAVGMYGDKAAEAIEHPTPALLRLCGGKSFPVELVILAEAGDEWALGLPTNKAGARASYAAIPAEVKDILAMMAPPRRGQKPAGAVT